MRMPRRIAREMVRSLYGSERVKPLPPVANAQVRVIARKLAAESDGRFQHAFFQVEDREQGAFFSGLMKHVVIGGDDLSGVFCGAYGCAKTRCGAAPG